VRDLGAVGAALIRPQTGRYTNGVPEAAAYLEGLAINHPFVGRNKHIAFAAVPVFARINGWRMQAAPMQIDAESLTEARATANNRVAELAVSEAGRDSLPSFTKLARKRRSSYRPTLASACCSTSGADSAGMQQRSKTVQTCVFRGS
jgi:prophage maintenance system killer protein